MVGFSRPRAVYSVHCVICFETVFFFIDITSMKLSINTTFPKTLYAAYATYLPHTTPIRFISALDLPQKPTAVNPLGASSV
jgi:hypothetical protein